MYKLKKDFKDLGALWKKSAPLFISSNLLDCFFNSNKTYDHIFLEKNNSKIYANRFNITFEKSGNYLNNSLFFRLILRYFKINTLFLANTFLTNVSSFKLEEKISLKSLLAFINHKLNFFMIIIPDVLFEKLDTNFKHGFIKVQIEEDMVLDVNQKWNNIDDYKDALRTKYKKKIIDVELRSSSIDIRKISIEKFSDHELKMQKLFNQVILSSKFNGPQFNVATLKAMLKKNICDVYGYFLNNKLVGFSSEISYDRDLYSYYVGFEQAINKHYSIYARILLETINNAIRTNKKKIVYGRTANEFKSNFGAVPACSYIYIRAKNNFINIFMRLIFSSLKKKDWIIRKPFKLTT